MAAPGILLIILASVLALVVGVLAIVYLVVPAMKGTAKGVGWLFRGIGRVIAHFYRFIAGMLTDALRMVGLFIAGLFLVPVAVGNVLIGRWSSATHFGREMASAWGASGRALYRVCVGHPARFLLLGPMLDEIEHRVPDAVAQAPGADRPSRRTGQFDGYTIVGSLPGGGSGGKLYVAEPSDLKRAALERSTGLEIDQVVIKSFSVREGSTVPQIVRESRALEAARKLGLVLDHELTDERFFYVMPYVPGESLTLVTRRMHSESEAGGLDERRLREAMGYIADLVTTLERYHRGGLWHKDVKPDNIIVHNGTADLVDFGLITPLRSAMTLTTHGTEYFRDPEMVRLALRGVKVHEVDGVKFDIYGAGAVLYSVIENSFPAHGGLSQISKRCPEALRWIVRRAMTDINTRYANAGEMLADLRAVQNAHDVFALKPADLPSVRGGGQYAPEAPAEPDEFAEAMGRMAQAAPPVPPASPGPVRSPEPTPAARKRPTLAVADWWTGRYSVQGENTPAPPEPAVGAARVTPVRHTPARPARSGHKRPPASAQLKSARARVQAAQKRAQNRRRARSVRGERFDNRPNAGVVLATVFMLTCVVGVGAALLVPAVTHRGGGHVGPSQFGEPVNAVALRYDSGHGTTPVYITPGEILVDDPAVLETVREARLDIPYVQYHIDSDASAPEDVRALFSAPPRLLLVINDLPVGSRDESRVYLDHVARLIADENMGLTEDTDLVAKAKSIIGLRSSSDAEARYDLGVWLRTQVDRSIFGVLWLDADAEAEGGVDRRLITRTEFDSEEVAGAMMSLRAW